MAGRKTKYNKEFDEQAYKLCLLGHTDAELAKFFEVNEDTIHEWKKRHKTFSESIKKGKDIADADVAESLYQRAKGYEHPDVDIKQHEGRIIVTEIVKHYPPDTRAIQYWMNNRRRQRTPAAEGQSPEPTTWADRHEVDHTTGGDKLPAAQVYMPQDLPEDIVPVHDPSTPPGV